MTIPFVEIDRGDFVRFDPEEIGHSAAIAKLDCRRLYEESRDKITYYLGRFEPNDVTFETSVIVIINVDDPNGRLLAGMLMPAADMHAIRARGETPIMRGLAMRDGMQEALEIFDPEAADKLKTFDGPAIVVVDQGVAEVFGPVD